MNKTQTLVRIDKNFAYNILDFEKFDESKLIKDLLFYISFTYQNHTDLFGFGLLDPKNFASVMSLDYSNLFRKHPNPFQLLNLSDNKINNLLQKENDFGRMSEHRLWTSYLENALYILKSKPVYSVYKHKDDNKVFIEEKNFIILESIGIQINKIKGQKKLLYKYKLNKLFIANLKKFFLNAELKTYIELKKPNLDNFFITVSNLIQSLSAKNINGHYFKFDELAELLKVSQKEPKFVKRDINKKMKLVLPYLEPLFKNISFFWVKGNGQRFAYVPAISWTLEKKEKKESEFSQSIHKDIFRNDIRHEFLEFFRYNYFDNLFTELHSDNETKQFFLWLVSDKDLSEKTALFITVYSRYNKTTSRFFKPVDAAKQFFKDIKMMKTERSLVNYLNTF